MLENVPAAIGHALNAIRPGLGKVVYAREDLAAPETMKVTSDAFVHEGAMASRYTQDGARISPPLRFAGLPEGARSLALIVEDADSPRRRLWFTPWFGTFRLKRTPVFKRRRSILKPCRQRELALRSARIPFWPKAGFRPTHRLAMVPIIIVFRFLPLMRHLCSTKAPAEAR